MTQPALRTASFTAEGSTQPGSAMIWLKLTAGTASAPRCLMDGWKAGGEWRRGEAATIAGRGGVALGSSRGCVSQAQGARRQVQGVLQQACEVQGRRMVSGGPCLISSPRRAMRSCRLVQAVLSTSAGGCMSRFSAMSSAEGADGARMASQRAR